MGYAVIQTAAQIQRGMKPWNPTLMSKGTTLGWGTRVHRLLRSSFFAFNEEASEILQVRRGGSVFVKLGAGFIHERVGLLQRFLDSK